MIRSIFCLCVLASWAGTAASAPIYSQPSDFPQNGSIGVYASQKDGSTNPMFPNLGNFATAYDNFRLTTTSAVNSVSWQGGYFNPPTPAGPFQGTITEFTLRFYADNNGMPEQNFLVSYTIPGNAGETLVGKETGIDATGNLIFNYAANLPSTFVAQAATTYWLSIVPTLDSDNAGFWGWHTDRDINSGDTRLVQDFTGRDAGRRVFADDLAFALDSSVIGPAVPEPTTLLAGLLVGGTACGFFRRRRAVPA